MKTTGKTEYQPHLEISTFEDEAKLCTAKLLRTYIQQTEKLKSRDTKQNKLLLTYKKALEKF